MESPQIKRTQSMDSMKYSFHGIEELFAWAKAHSHLCRDSLYWAKSMDASEVETLQLILVAFIKDEERRTKESLAILKTGLVTPTVSLNVGGPR